MGRLAIVALTSVIFIGIGGCSASNLQGSLGSATSPSDSSKTLTFEWIGYAVSSLNQWFTGQSAVSAPGDGKFARPVGIAVDPSNGFLYVVSFYWSYVSKHNLSTGAYVGSLGKSNTSTGTCPNGATASGWCTGATTGWGLGDGDFYGPWGIAVDSTNGFFYVSDYYYNRIQKFNLATGAFVGAIGKVAGSTGTCPLSGAAPGWCTGGYFVSGSGDGQFNRPQGVQIANGILYVVDINNHRIQKFNATTGAFLGAIGRTTATTGDCPASGAAPGWCTGGTFSSGAGDGMFNSPQLMSVDTTSGVFYVSDLNNHRVEKFELTSGAFLGAIGRTTATSGSCPASGAAPGWCTGGTFASGAGDGMFNGPEGIAFDLANGFLYVADFYNDRMSKFNLTTGAYLGSVGKLAASTGTCPSSGAASGWCSGGTFANGTGDGEFTSPRALQLDTTTGTLYVTDEDNGRILKFNAATGAFSAQLGAVASSNSGWLTDNSSSSSSSSRDGGFSWPSGAVTDSQYLYTVDDANCRVVKSDLTTGAFIGAIGGLSGSTGTCPASGAAPGWCTGGVFTCGGSDGMFGAPWHIAIDNNGYLYISDISSHRVVKVNAATGAFVGAIGKTTASTGTCPASGPTGWCTGGTFTSGNTDGAFNRPEGVAVDSENGILYVASAGASMVSKVNLTTGVFIGAIGNVTASTGTCPASGPVPGWCTGGSFTSGGVDGTMNWPMGIALDKSHGYLYIADNSNSRVIKVLASTGAMVGSIGARTTTLASATQQTDPQTFSVAAWFKTTSTAGGKIIGFGSSQTGASSSYDRHIYMNAKGQVYFGVYHGVGTTVSGYGPYNDGNWHHVVGTFQANSLKLYIDGALVDSSTVPPYAEHYNGYWRIGYDRLGSWYNVNGSVFYGQLEDVAVWSSVLSAADVSAIYSSSTALGPSSPQWASAVSVWHFDEASGSTFADATGNNNTITATGPSINTSSGKFGGSITIGQETGYLGLGTGFYVTGNSDGALAWPEGVAVDETNGYLYVADPSNNRVSRYDLVTMAYLGSIGNVVSSTGTCPSSGVTTKWCTGGKFGYGLGLGSFSWVTSLAVDALGNLFAVDSDFARVIRIRQ